MLNITDLTSSKDMDSKEMAAVAGGTSPLALIDFSSDMNSKVAAVTQGFNFAFGQHNAGAVTNNQMIAGGNGWTLAPVDQAQHQENWMDVSDIGNVSVS